MKFKKGNQAGKAPKAGKGTGRKKKATTLAREAGLKGFLPLAESIIEISLRSGCVDTAIWVWEQEYGKARQRVGHEGEVVIRVLRDGA